MPRSITEKHAAPRLLALATFATLVSLACGCGGDTQASGSQDAPLGGGKDDPATCKEWCDTEAAMACPTMTRNKLDCANYCAHEGACGNAGPVLACYQSHPDAFYCDLGGAFARDPCVSVFQPHYRAVSDCLETGEHAVGPSAGAGSSPGK